MRRGPSAAPAYLLGRSVGPALAEVRRFLDANGAAYRWVDVDTDPLARGYRLEGRLGALRLPVLVLPDGSTIEAPDGFEDAFDTPPAHVRADPRYMEAVRWRARLAGALGLATQPSRHVYDVTVIGAGPAGLTAAVYAASEGLRTLVVERHVVGGQAGTSARIENYLGFPRGVSGAELAGAAREQALRFGAEIILGSEVLGGVPRPDGPTMLELSNGAVVETRAGVLAVGVHYRRLEAPGVDDLRGAGVSYGSSPLEAASYEGRHVAIVGGANSAGQAALHAAGHARLVTLLVRGASLEASMSRYLVERILAAPTISVRMPSEVVRAEGDGRLERLTVRDTATGEEAALDVDELVVHIGGDPLTAGVRDWLRLDERGYIMTGPDLVAGGGRDRWWPLARDPFPLETSYPGLFAAGDVRHGSTKRVASAVGEGAMAVNLAHLFLSANDPRSEPARGRP